MKNRNELLEERTELISGREVSENIKSGIFIATQPESCIKQHSCRIDDEKGGIFMWSPQMSKYFLIAKKK
jgi:hypothetical protein